MLFYFFESSNSTYVKFLAAAGIKELLTTNLNKIPPRIPVEKLITFKDYLMTFIRERATQSDKAVVKMVITLLSKLVKLSWFDQPALKSVVGELLQIQSLSEGHFMISLNAIHDIMLEMSYHHRSGRLIFHRRIAICFRDECLNDVFKQSLMQVQQYTDTIL